MDAVRGHEDAVWMNVAHEEGGLRRLRRSIRQFLHGRRAL
ncbi:hypothetical protein [Limimaricola sp. AA108-03]